MSFASTYSQHSSRHTEAGALRSTEENLQWDNDWSLNLDSEQAHVSNHWIGPQIENLFHPRCGQQSLQGSASFEHSDETGVMIRMTDAFQSEALSMLAEYVNAPANPNTPEHREKVFSLLDNLTVEKYDGELAEQAKKLSGHFQLEPAFQLLRFSVYLASNNLLLDDKTDKLVQWIKKTGSQKILYRLLDLKTPTTEISESCIFVSAARLGFTDIVQGLVTKGVNINALAGEYPRQTALEEAVQYGHFRTAQVLLDAGADPKPRIGSRHSVIRDALKRHRNQATLDSHRRHDMIQMIIRNGADVNEPAIDSYPHYPLTCAAYCSDFASVRILLEAGARINNMHPFLTITALQASIRDEEEVDLLQFLIDRGAVVNAPAGRPYSEMCKAAAEAENFTFLTTPIQHASLANNTEAVQILIDEGADVNACPWEDYIGDICLAVAEESGNELQTALQAAVTNRNAPLVRVLLMADADVNALGCPLTALQIAADGADIKIASILLKHGADVNQPAKAVGGRTALQAAASTYNCEIVALLLGAGADVNGAASPSGGRTALQAAASTGYCEIVALLLDAGADVNGAASLSGGRTALQAAAEYGNIDVVKILIRAGAAINANASPKNGLTCLQTAAKNHETEVVRLLLEQGADVNAPAAVQSGGLTALQASLTTAFVERPKITISEYYAQNPTMRVILNAGADVNAPPSPCKGVSTLEAAITNNCSELVQYLILWGIDPNLYADSNSSILAAVLKESADILLMLIKAGSDINMVCKSGKALHEGKTALEAATSIGSVPMTRILLDAGADANKIACPHAPYPLRQAAAEGRVEVVNLLLHAGAQVNLTSEDKKTALQAAVSSQNLDLIQTLMNAGADINSPPGPKHGRTALQKAAEHGDVNIVKFFLSHDADVNAPAADSYGITALQGAAAGGHLKVVLILLKAGADINAPAAKAEGREALEAAAEHGRLDIVLLLLKNDGDVETIGLRCRQAAKLAELKGHYTIMRILKEHRVSRDPTT